MINGDQVKRWIDAQVAACRTVENVIYGKIEYQVSLHVIAKVWEQSWPWGRIQRVEQAVREQLRDNWKLPGGEGAPKE